LKEMKTEKSQIAINKRIRQKINVLMQSNIYVLNVLKIKVLIYATQEACIIEKRQKKSRQKVVSIVDGEKKKIRIFCETSASA